MSHWCKLWCQLTVLLLAACIARNIQAAATPGRDDLRSQLYPIDAFSRAPLDDAVRLAWGRQRDTTPLLRPAGSREGRVWQSSRGRPFATQEAENEDNANELSSDLSYLWFLAKRDEFQRARDENSEEPVVDYEPNDSSLTSLQLDEVDDLTGGLRAGELDPRHDRDVNREIFAYPALRTMEGGAFDTERNARGSLRNLRFGDMNAHLTGRDYFEDDKNVVGTADHPLNAGPLIDAIIDDVKDWLRDGSVNSASTRFRGSELLMPQDADDVGRVASPFDRPSAPDTDFWHSHVEPAATGDSLIKIQRRQERPMMLYGRADRTQRPRRRPSYTSRVPLALEKHDESRPSYKDRTPLKAIRGKKACGPRGKLTSLITCSSDASVCLRDNMLCDGSRDCPNGEDESVAWCILRYLVSSPLHLPFVGKA